MSEKKSISWLIDEESVASKTLDDLPKQVLRKYEFWKEVIENHGPVGLLKWKGFHDHTLLGKREGQRSSSLNKQWRVIYSIEKEIVTVYVEEITPHKH